MIIALLLGWILILLITPGLVHRNVKTVGFDIPSCLPNLKEKTFHIFINQLLNWNFCLGNIYIYRHNDPSRFVFTIRKGLAKLVYINRNGGQRIIRLLKRGGLVGMEALNNRKRQSLTIVTNSKVSCFYKPKKSGKNGINDKLVR